MYWPTDTWEGGHTSRGVTSLEGAYNEIDTIGSSGLTISSSGSYKLTSNISFSTQDTDAITIISDNVTIDLNGFSITGPGNSTGSSGSGIICSGNYQNIVIKNGTIRSFVEDGVSLYHVASGNYDARASAVIGVKAYNNGRWGITAGTSVRIKNCVADTNGQNTASGTLCGGIFVNDTCIVKDCVLNDNKGCGIYTYINNLLVNNNVNGTEFQSGVSVGSGISIHTNNNVIDNIVTRSQGSASNVLYGICIIGDGNLIDSNNISRCSYIDVLLYSSSGENTIVGNHIRSTVDYENIYVAGGDDNMINSNHLVKSVGSQKNLLLTGGSTDNYYALNIENIGHTDNGSSNTNGASVDTALTNTTP